jgi:uncharacterized protein
LAADRNLLNRSGRAQGSIFGRTGAVWPVLQGLEDVADTLAERITAFLDAHHVMSLATAGPQGPHVASLFYARDGFALLWVSDRTSRHSLELGADARVEATIAPDYSDHAAIRGLQVAGRARSLVDEPERVRARRILETRYPFLRHPGDGNLRESYARAQVYRLEAIRYVLIDNTRGFGHKDVLEISDGMAD